MVLALTSCADFPKNISDQMKAVNAALTPNGTNAAQTSSQRKVGTITNEQCKTSVGKTKSYFE